MEPKPVFRYDRILVMTAVVRKRIPNAGVLLAQARIIAPGLALCIGGVVAAYQLHRFTNEPAPLVLAVLLGFIAGNLGLIKPIFRPGITFAVKKLLRVGVVLLGFRLSLHQVQSIGLRGFFSVVIVVTVTFFSTQYLAAKLGLSRDLGLLVATGYSICGASAIAAVQPLTNAEDEEVTYAVGLVTLCGSLSIAVLPAIGHLLGMSPGRFGAFAGAAVHDVAQVLATATSYSNESTASATVVKLTRVFLLGPLVMVLGAAKRKRDLLDVANNDNDRSGSDTPPAKRPPLMPIFLIGFVAAAAIRSYGSLSSTTVGNIKIVEQYLLAVALFGLGSNVSIAKLRKVGGRPLVLGLASWVVVASLALATTTLFKVG
jgi:uncharacterized integral membrane protein (TIGR00698 family)